MSVENNVSGKYFGTSSVQPSKELEIISFKELSKGFETNNRKSTSSPRLLKKKSKVSPSLVTKRKESRTQIEFFQKSMKLLLIFGQLIGINPVIGITNVDISKMRFTFCSLWFVYACLVLGCQLVLTAFSIYRLANTSVSISILAFVSFYAGTCLTTFLFIRIASKWPSLMKKIAESSLDKYIDSTIHTKCFNATMILMVVAILEHLLSQKTNITDSYNCVKNISMYEKYLELSFAWYKDFDCSFKLPIGIIFHFMNIICTINWSYSDLFLVCMSFYLLSILEKINKTIKELDQRFYHPTSWSTLREDYTKAANLITAFDDVICGVMLVSFASNLFFICLQLFHILSSRNIFDNLIYFTFSLVFVLGRFLAVSLAAASVNTASRVPASALYMVPSTAYCGENAIVSVAHAVCDAGQLCITISTVQRFIEQVHGHNVALSGLRFFYITKELVLTVAGTIVTYELVLLQFNGEDL